MSESRTPQRAAHGSRRMPKNSFFYDKVVPILLLLLSVFLALLLLVALAGVLGWIHL